MLASLKAIGVTAAISAGVVTAYDHPAMRFTEAPAGKTFYERILPSEPTAAPGALAYAAPAAGEVKEGKSDSLRLFDDSCGRWPNLSRDCIVSTTGSTVRVPTRTITIERREGENTTILVRLPDPTLR
jgi:hypothetical protein